jgi:ATP-dependent helicase HrpB
MIQTNLPIASVLPELAAAMRESMSVVLVAPPGAGKTTVVPLALLEEPWLNGKRILMLEPRRLAARGAARRLAETLGETVGGRVGLRARLETRVSGRTQLEVMTEGVFTRMILDDPALEDVGAVLFDEFHERSLDSDFGLALARDIQTGLREDLRILVMSATLDGARVSEVLGDAPLIESSGRAYPVETRYLGRPHGRRIEDAVASAIRSAVQSDEGSILAFLPGQAEIRRTEERLREMLPAGAPIIAPLYGGLDTKAQDAAIQPPPPGIRKVVLATAIAETSLTIEGVRIVIDSGLARVPRYDPSARVTRLATVRVSRASADQRRGRAGRLEPGICYRLWDEPETRSLRPHETPEIRSADLSGLVLDCAAWGVAAPQTLTWLDPPPQTALDFARAELVELGALGNDGRITDFGANLRGIALPPRLAAMVVRASTVGQADDAAEIAAIIVEHGLGGTAVELEERLRNFRRDRSPRAQSMRRLMKSWSDMAKAATAPSPGEAGRSPAGLLTFAYPDRIARSRGTPGTFVLANGRGALIDPVETLAASPFLTVAELTGTAAAGRITLAASLTEHELIEVAGHRLTETTTLTFDRNSQAVRARRERRLGQIVLESRPVPVAADASVTEALCQGIVQLGIGCLPWSRSQNHLLQRIRFLQQADPDGVPDLSEARLAATIETWLGPFLEGKFSLDAITASDLEAALSALVPWALRQRADAETPTHFTAPTGNRHPIDYEHEGAPSIALRVQELFGLEAHPTIAHGKLPLTLRLLSPAGRPIQITRDLPGFWAGSWRDVAADMKGRYPKHPWPDDPANATPTAHAKPRKR